MVFGLETMYTVEISLTVITGRFRDLSMKSFSAFSGSSDVF